MKIVIATLALALAIGTTQAQTTPMKKKAAVTAAKATVAADKAEVEMNKEARKADKATGNDAALKEDRKQMVNKKTKLLKDQVKKDVKQVEQKF